MLVERASSQLTERCFKLKLFAVDHIDTIPRSLKAVSWPYGVGGAASSGAIW